MVLRRIIVIICAALVFVAMNIGVRFAGGGAQIDMSAQRIYTVSNATKDVLRGLKTPLDLTLYYSADLANGAAPIQAYAARVEGVMKQYARLSGGAITAKTIHPSVFSAAEDDALGYGVQGIPVSANGERFYFGMVGAVNQGAAGDEDFKAIKFLDPAREGNLEQDLTTLIYDLGIADKPTVGILSSFRMQTQDYIDIPAALGADPERWQVVNQIKYNYDVRHLSSDGGVIDDDIDILMIVHPHGFSDEITQAAADYIMRGGKAMVFVDPHSERAAAGHTSSHAPQILSALGVRVAQNEIIADRTQGVRVQFQSFDSRLTMIDKLNWPAVTGAQINRDFDVTKALSTVRLASAGHITGMDTAVTLTPLLTSTDNAMVVTPTQIETPQSVITNFKAAGDAYTYGALVRGGTHDVHAIVVADTDMLRDEFWIQSRNFHGGTLMTQSADNGAFVVNALDYLSGNTALVGLRSRRAVARTFTRTQDLRRAAEAQYLAKEKGLKEALTRLQNDLEAAQKRGASAGDNAADKTAAYRADIVKTRKELRAVQHDLRRDIDDLGVRVKLFNILLMPFFVLLGAFFVPPILGVRRR